MPRKKLKTDNIVDALKKIGQKLAEDARENLRKGGPHGPHIATKRLINSVRYIVTKKGDDYEVVIESLRYGNVLDKGLSGTQVKRAGTPFYAVDGGTSAGHKIAVNYYSIIEWAVAKGIIPDNRDTGGVAYAITQSIIRKGYPATKWITRAVQESEAGRISLLEQAAAKDITLHIKRIFA